MKADGMMRDLHEVEGAHLIWSDGCGRFGQSDRFHVSSGVKSGVPVIGSG